MKRSTYRRSLARPLVGVLVLGGVLAVAGSTGAQVTGRCSNCHTMHNSQDASPMTLNESATPNPMLTRGDCMGCHASGTNQKMWNIDGVTFIPQVFHTDASGDLAGGNFAYINDTKAGGIGDGDNRGHNVIDIFGPGSDDNLSVVPGGILQYYHDQNVTDLTLTCAGENGCHGERVWNSGVTGLAALKGAHHGNTDGACNPPLDNPTVGDSYRFLLGVKGYENQTSGQKWQNVSASSHNEYFGQAVPNVMHCSGGTGSCHFPGGPIRPRNQTISGFCGTCHGNFHTLKPPTSDGSESSDGQSMGIGPAVTSPFRRHPTDIVINRLGAGSEYSQYTTYNVNAPVGRTTVLSAPSAVVTPASDTVTCLSCHMVHASPYPDMLRWNYDALQAHSGSNTNGCFICHTTKDDV
ncbi:MAG: cytochrome c3 family protein [Thermodesulfobacteriota bacterium]